MNEGQSQWLLSKLWAWTRGPSQDRVKIAPWRHCQVVSGRKGEVYHSAAASWWFLAGCFYILEMSFYANTLSFRLLVNCSPKKSSYANLALFLSIGASPTKGTFALAWAHSTRGKGDKRSRVANEQLK